MLVLRREPSVPWYFVSVRGFQAVVPYMLGESLDKFDIGAVSLCGTTAHVKISVERRCRG